MRQQFVDPVGRVRWQPLQLSYQEVAPGARITRRYADSHNYVDSHNAP